MSKIIFILLIIISFSSNAQYYNQTPEFLKTNIRWAFGQQGSGLDFSSGTTTPWATSITGEEGFSTVSDRNTGKLLFYTNGGSVWNANHQLMPNGTGLLGNSYTDYYTTWQGSLIVPFINDSTKYYLFSLTPYTGGWMLGIGGSLFYNIVDMTSDNNNGDVDPNHKNMVLDTSSLSESLIAIPGCNNDVWVVTYSSYPMYFPFYPQVYKAYHITENGINPVPVISPSNLAGGREPYGVQGSLSVSPDRKKVVMTDQYATNIELCEFNISDGIFFNSITIPNLSSNHYTYGTAFSPDNSKLYISYQHVNSTMPSYTYQYEISNLDSTAIETSKQLVFSGSAPVLRLYNDTIYFREYPTSNIHRINKPNEYGTSCDVQMNVISLGANTSLYVIGMGSDVVFAIPTDTIIFTMDTLICTGLEDKGVFLTAKDTSFAGYQWSTGDTTSSVLINQHGTYYVIYYSGCNNYYLDSFIIRGSDLLTTITVDGFQLGTTGGPFTSYQWYLNGEPIPGANNSTLTVTENGHYAVEITDEYGCVYRSDVYEVTNVNIYDIHYIARSISIYPNPANDLIYIKSPEPVQAHLCGIDGRSLIEVSDVREIPVSALPDGLYLLRIMDKEGRLLKVEKIRKQQP